MPSQTELPFPSRGKGPGDGVIARRLQAMTLEASPSQRLPLINTTLSVHTPTQPSPLEGEGFGRVRV